MIVSAAAGEDRQALVFLTELLEVATEFDLRHSFREVILLAENHLRGDVRVEVIDRLSADLLEHYADILLCVRHEFIAHRLIILRRF